MIHRLIIQFGVLPLLAVYAESGMGRQVPGTSGTGDNVRGKIYVSKKKPRKGGTAKEAMIAEPEVGGGADSDSSSGNKSDGQPANALPKKKKHKAPAAKVDLNNRLVWGKNVDPILWEYISTKTCRCDVADKHFNNPPTL
ncbi:hypothetical protein DFH07DRAFT_785881 [Mycena maculata]|uniref:Uncharacterized protein n=1 Tax=Mycena maculata TaxID=230809 RepID=A0AAD7MEQ9_9AGAR|nr:hypothetical protein DFH07DRAFT_785881 [Mycena maculata]